MKNKEREFADYLDSQGKKWIYKPKALDTGKPRKKRIGNITYTPNFFCIDDNCYYEVVFSRQSHEVNIRKIKGILFINKNITIKSVWPNGEEYGTYPYNKNKYITTEDLKEKFDYGIVHIHQLLNRHNIEYKTLRNTKKVYDKESAIELFNRWQPYYSIDWRKIKEIRKKYQVPIQKLADFLDIHWVLLSKYENGRSTRTRSKERAMVLNNLEDIVIENIEKLKYVKNNKNNRSFESYYQKRKEK